MEAVTKLKSFWKFFLLGFGVKQIIDSLSLFFLLTHTVLNFNENNV